MDRHMRYLRAAGFVLEIYTCMLLWIEYFPSILVIICTATYLTISGLRTYVYEEKWTLVMRYYSFFIQAFIALVMMEHGTVFPVIYFYYLLIAQMAFSFSKRRTMLFFVVQLGGFVLVQIGKQQTLMYTVYTVFNRGFEWAMIAIVFYLFGLAHANNRLLQSAFRKLSESTRQIEEKTLLEERARLSQDLHDIVGHTLMSAIVVMETVRKASNHSPQVHSLLGSSIVSVKQGLDEVRKTMQMLSSNQSFIHFRKSLIDLIEQTAQQTGRDISYAICHHLDDLTPEQEMTFYRILQEAFANGIRHGHASAFRVNLLKIGTIWRFTVEDNGSGFSRLQMGLGLRSMKNRVEQVKGTMQVKSRLNNGTIVAVEIPLQNSTKKVLTNTR